MKIPTAQVLVNLSLDRCFDYRIPEHLSEKVKVGMKVMVPFGRGNSRREAYVVALRVLDIPDEQRNVYKDIFEDEEELIDEFDAYKAESCSNGEKKYLCAKNNEVVDDYDFQEFLLEVMPMDLGFPDNVSEETRKIYENEPNEPSTPSYYTLAELSKHYYSYKNDGFNDLEGEIQDEFQNKVLSRLEYICDKLDDPEIKRGYKGIKDTADESNWRMLYTTLNEDLQCLHRNIWRIKTRAETGAPTVYSWEDIRVIWYIV